MHLDILHLLYVFKQTFNFHRFLVRVSYLEIYNEEVRDLLGKDQLQRLEVKLYSKPVIQTKNLLEDLS